MSERAFTSGDERLDQGVRQPPLSKSGRTAILSVVDEAVSIGEVRRAGRKRWELPG